MAIQDKRRPPEQMPAGLHLRRITAAESVRFWGEVNAASYSSVHVVHQSQIRPGEYDYEAGFRLSRDSRSMYRSDLLRAREQLRWGDAQTFARLSQQRINGPELEKIFTTSIKNLQRKPGVHDDQPAVDILRVMDANGNPTTILAFLFQTANVVGGVLVVDHGDSESFMSLMRLGDNVALTPLIINSIRNMRDWLMSGRRGQRGDVHDINNIAARTFVIFNDHVLGFSNLD